MACSVIEGSLATIMSTLLGGVFLTAFAHCTRGPVNWKSDCWRLLARWGGGWSQLGGAFAIERYGHRKLICLAATWISRLLWIPILFAGLLRPAVSHPVHRRAAGYFQPVCVHWRRSWLSSMKDLVPTELRLRFLGRRHIFNSGLAFAMSVGGELLVDAWSALAA